MDAEAEFEFEGLGEEGAPDLEAEIEGEEGEVWERWSGGLCGFWSVASSAAAVTAVISLPGTGAFLQSPASSGRRRGIYLKNGN